MKHVTKFLLAPFRWYWRNVIRFKYYILASTLLLLIIWYNCLPERLFSDATCTVLTDADNNILAARIADDGQWRFPPNATVPYKFKQAIIQFEDRQFFDHMGFSFKGFSRAVKQNIEAGSIVSGGSTISMQTIRLSRKGKSRNLLEKTVEVFQATRMELDFSKEEILSMYASNAPMGGNVIGLDAAAWRYFGRKASDLSWAEASTLAILPNAPGLIHPGKNRSILKDKRNRLLKRLYDIGEIDKLEYQLAIAEPIPDKPPILPDIAPHLMDRFIKEGKKGQWIQSSIDLQLQSKVLTSVDFHHKHLAQNQIHNAAVLVLDVETGKVKAYVGNTDGDDPEHGNAVDIITSARSTGSIMKPFLYACMIDKGELMPDQLIEDVPAVISGYAPKNYNEKYDGAVPASKALARSLNVPIINMLQSHGVQKFHYELNQLGLSTINRPSSDYGLTLVLGGAEATLWDLCGVYMNMARRLSNPDIQDFLEISLIQNPSNNKTRDRYMFSPAAIWTTFEALIKVARPDTEANWHQFSSSKKIAWKTGTSYGFRDAWAIGVTPKYVVGVWVGNADGEGRPGLVGFKAAAPIMFDVFDKLESSEWFDQPAQDMESVRICAVSGFRASDKCEHTKTVMVPSACLQTTACPYNKTIHLDPSERYRVNSTCEPVANIVSKNWFVLPPIVEKYYRSKNPNYKELPPFRTDCSGGSENNSMDIVYPKAFSEIYIPTNLDGSLSKTIFEASHRNESATIYWHIDEQYYGSTSQIHQLELIPKPGEHTLTLIDDTGNQIKRNFTVVGKD